MDTKLTVGIEKQYHAGRFKPGNPGKPKGAIAKVNKDFRATITALLENNSENVQLWLAQVANGADGAKPDPARALDLMARLAEYAAPKLGRVEHVGDGGGPVRVVASAVDERL
jgi:hypothetical protein